MTETVFCFSKKYMYCDLNYNNNSNLNHEDVLVVNLSDYQLPEPERGLLARRHKLCPTLVEVHFGILRVVLTP